MKNIFNTAYFGKPYKTRDGQKAIYWQREPNHVDWNRLIVANDNLDIICYDNGFTLGLRNNHEDDPLDIVSEWDDNRFFKCPYCGNVVEIGSSTIHIQYTNKGQGGKYIDCPCCKKRYRNKEITNNIFNIIEEYGNLNDQLDALNMRYLSQVSLWKSCYDELKQKILEQVDDKELDEQIAEKENPNYNISCNSLEYTRWNAGFVAGYKYLKSELEKFVNNKK